jgi:hypothetical protein
MDGMRRGRTALVKCQFGVADTPPRPFLRRRRSSVKFTSSLTAMSHILTSPAIRKTSSETASCLSSNICGEFRRSSWHYGGGAQPDQSVTPTAQTLQPTKTQPGDRRAVELHKLAFSCPRRVRKAARPSLTAALAQDRATWPYLPRLSSKSVMRRQNRASKSRQIDGDPCVGVEIDGGGIVVGILALSPHRTGSERLGRNQRREPPNWWREGVSQPSEDREIIDGRSEPR